MFLRFKERFWDAELVAHAICHVSSERAKMRFAEVEEELNIVSENEDSV